MRLYTVVIGLFACALAIGTGSAIELAKDIGGNIASIVGNEVDQGLTIFHFIAVVAGLILFKSAIDPLPAIISGFLNWMLRKAAMVLMVFGLGYGFLTFYSANEKGANQVSTQETASTSGVTQSSATIPE